MEFIPLQKSNEKNTKRPREGVQNLETEIKKSKKLIKNDVGSDPSESRSKQKPQTKVFLKKNVKNKYRETLVSKNEKRVSKKKLLKKVEEQNEKEEEDNLDSEEHEVKNETEEDGNNEDENAESGNEESEEEKNCENEAFKKKCREMDEKKKNRLFVKLKKKIHSESQIKELHPDIRAVIFPRKKNSSWCWAVFASEEKAKAGLKVLGKNKDIVVKKPIPYDKVTVKLKKKMKAVTKRKEAIRKIQKMWM